MKKNRIQKKIAVGLALSACLIAGGLPTNADANIAYTSTYNGSALPSVSTPEWFVDSTSGSTANIVGGNLVVSTMQSTDALYYWGIGTSYSDQWGTASAWNTSTATIDFRVSVTDSITNSIDDPRGFWIQVSDSSNRFWNFFVGDNKFYSTNMQSGDVVSVDLGVLGVDTTDFNVYRVALQNGVASVYVNDLEDAVFDSVAGVAFIDRTAILFGDAASFESASYQLDYLNWSNTTAVFAPAIPEPTTVGLLAIGGLGAFFRMARRKDLKR